jgi:hypothetical protein
MIHGYAINKRTPALLTSQSGSARDRQHHHHSPVAAALSARVQPAAWLDKRKSQLAATQRAPPDVQPAAWPDKKKIALFRVTISADLLQTVCGCSSKYRHPTEVLTSEWLFHFDVLVVQIIPVYVSNIQETIVNSWCGGQGESPRLGRKWG